jgi:hypothetical protein
VVEAAVRALERVVVVVDLAEAVRAAVVLEAVR